MPAIKSTLKDFIAQARITHGDKYDYSLTDYKGDAYKVVIVCPKHGPFEQTAGNHKRRNGCRRCMAERFSQNTALTQVEFIEKARAKHGNKYDYSQAVYAGNKQPVLIICPIHGLFKQEVSKHLRGNECKKCGDAKAAKQNSLTQAEFIKQSRTTHNNKYDYSRVEYTKGTAKVAIICPKHGLFEQVSGKHLRGHGCVKCRGDLTRKTQSLPLAKFLEKAYAKHGTKYDYSRTIYVNAKTKISAICPIHGLFEQKPHNHIRCDGCPNCSKEKKIICDWVQRAKGKLCLLYLLRIFDEKESFFKVGITCRSLKKRFSKKAALAHYKYEVVALHESNNAVSVFEWEQSILQTFAHLRYHPKAWFDGATECFSSEHDILACFPL